MEIAAAVQSRCRSRGVTCSEEPRVAQKVTSSMSREVVCPCQLAYTVQHRPKQPAKHRPSNMRPWFANRRPTICPRPESEEGNLPLRQ